MILIVIVGTVVALGIVALLWAMWESGEFILFAAIIGSALFATAAICALIVMAIQGTYEIGWCPSANCRIW